MMSAPSGDGERRGEMVVMMTMMMIMMMMMTMKGGARAEEEYIPDSDPLLISRRQLVGVRFVVWCARCGVVRTGGRGGGTGLDFHRSSTLAPYLRRG